MKTLATFSGSLSLVRRDGTNLDDTYLPVWYVEDESGMRFFRLPYWPLFSFRMSIHEDDSFEALAEHIENTLNEGDNSCQWTEEFDSKEVASLFTLLPQDVIAYAYSVDEDELSAWAVNQYRPIALSA
jgi:hypothetical protein